MARKSAITAYVDEETAALLRRISQTEFRSDSSTIAMLIRAEAARRGMIGRPPASEQSRTA